LSKRLDKRHSSNDNEGSDEMDAQTRIKWTFELIKLEIAFILVLAAILLVSIAFHDNLQSAVGRAAYVFDFTLTAEIVAVAVLMAQAVFRLKKLRAY
jgi:uncharacterized membrane protein YcjF (UPF0283 family)